jgi:hypothetical protein
VLGLSMGFPPFLGLMELAIALGKDGLFPAL